MADHPHDSAMSLFPSLNLAAGEAAYQIRALYDYNGDGSRESVVSVKNTTTGSATAYLVAINADHALVGQKMALPSTEVLVPGRDSYFDANHDGRADLYGISGGHLKIASWTGPMNATDYSSAFTTTTAVWTGSIATLDSSNIVFYPGDFNGDGWSDLAVFRRTGSSSTCGFEVSTYLNQRNAQIPSFSETGGKYCLWFDAGNPRSTDNVYGAQDFNGDGLDDIIITRSVGVLGTKLDRIVFSSTAGGVYSSSAFSFASQFPLTDSISSVENDPRNRWLLADINGDGLADFVTARPGKTAANADTGFWTVRLNTGRGLGIRIFTSSNAGIEVCSVRSGSVSYSDYCKSAWSSRSFLTSGDTDNNGVSEILIPRRFVSRICQRIPNAGESYYACPERPDLVDFEFIGAEIDGDLAKGMYTNGLSGFDASSYGMDSLRFTESSTGGLSVQQIPTPIIARPGVESSIELFGDGVSDFAFLNGTSIQWPARLTTDANGRVLTEQESPTTLPNGDSYLSREGYVLEGLGVGTASNAITAEPPDLMTMATDGFGMESKWLYSPLSSQAGRSVGQSPLYSVPMDPSLRYIDERHIYFTSSMQVVASMIRSDGIGGYRTWRYGYGEAMYNTQGRGFQGFRTIIEEDVQAGLRTTTTFHQKFPLTSQPERVAVNPISRTGEDGAITKTQYTWRCDRTNRANANACVPVLGTPTKYFPFLDTKETWAYDATTALGTGTPAVTGYTQEIAADDGACVGTLSSTSGYDAYGNLTARTTISRDLGAGSASGKSNRLDRQCVSEMRSYSVDAANWWLDKLNASTATTQVAWDGAQHALPSGTANPVRTVTMAYTWNADRTPATETVQSGVANQQRVTAYTYPATNNYGLPTGVAVAADGDSNGTRSTGTSYTADGYFPLAVTNALGHSATTSVRTRDGQPTLVTDANGLRTLIEYDAFGFATRKKFRGATDAVYVAPDQQMSLMRCVNGGPCWRPVEKVQVTTVQDGAPTTIQRLDAFGRVSVAAQKMLDGDWSHVVTERDTLGRMTWVTEPLISYQPNWAYTTFFYDTIGRMTQKRVPKQGEDGRGDMVTSYSYSGRTTSIQVCGSNDAPGSTNCLNLSRTTDSLGRYVETRDAQSGRTRFWYEANGNVAAIEDANGVVTKAAYNAIGQRSSVVDPNQGTWSFVYDALGEVTSQTDARNIVTSFGYDVLGRPRWRTANVDVTGDAVVDLVEDSWTYDPVNAKGAPDAQMRQINGSTERWSGTTYDTLARPVQVDVVQAMTSGTQQYKYRTKYDSYYGRPIGQEYPNGEAVQQLYSNYGHALAEKDLGTGIEYRRTNAVSPRGQATQETFGNGLVLNATYQFQTGQITGLTYSSGASNLRQLGYGYDVYGNLTHQSLNGGTSREDYSYDQLQRMVSAIRSGAASGTVNYGYDAVGNLGKKSDFSADTANAYVYTGGSCGGGANAVKSVSLAAGGGTRTYCYDANGNLTSDSAGLVIAYDHQNLPIKATRGAQTDWFRYGADGQRTRSWGSDGARVYLPGYEHRTDTGETKVYVGDYAVISRTGSTRKVEYMLKDRLGSVDAVASSAGVITETRGYDAFGKPRDGTWNDLNPAKIVSTAVTPKGFTQHEHLNQLELIHMNGRVYDYGLGRFTGVDPFVQFPLNSQSLNPYSYILNNPLSGRDPTGYATCNLTSGTGCLEDGKNIIVDSAGNNIGTLTLGNGKSVFSPNFSGITSSLKANAAEWGGRVAARAKLEASSIGQKIEKFLPAAGAFLQRGDLGTAQSNQQGFGLALASPFVEFYNEFTGANALKEIGVVDITLPSIKYENDQLLGATAGEVLPYATWVLGEARAAMGAGTMRGPMPGTSAKEIASLAESARISALRARAEQARDALVAAERLKKHQRATVIGAFSPSKGEVTAQFSMGGGKGCAENACEIALGFPSDIMFTRAIRPRTMRPKSTCLICEYNYGRGPFVDPRNKYESDGHP